MKRFYEFSTSWNVVEVYEIDMVDDPDGLIMSYEEHCGGSVTFMPDRRDEALEEMRTDLARELVSSCSWAGPEVKLLGVEMEQAEDIDMHVVERLLPRKHLMHPRVWSTIMRAAVLLDPLEQLCVVMNNAANAGFEDGGGI